MPKLIPKPEDEFKRKVLANIDYHCAINNIDKEHERHIVQCSLPTLNLRIRDPGKFTLDELYRLAKKFKVEPWELIKTS